MVLEEHTCRMDFDLWFLKLWGNFINKSRLKKICRETDERGEVGLDWEWGIFLI